MVYITGDTHADWKRFTMSEFPEQKELTRDDFVIVCGDFGVWHKNKKYEGSPAIEFPIDEQFVTIITGYLDLRIKQKEHELEEI